MKQETVLVTGSNGFIGSALVRRLLEEGKKVRCLVRASSNVSALQGLEVEFVYGEITQKQTLAPAVTGVDYIYHLAGAVKAVDLLTFIKVNAWGVINLLETALQVNPGLKRFLNVSSIAASAPGNSLDHPVDETVESAPVSNYGVSKMEGEQMALHFNQQIPVTIVRPVTVYGPRETELFQYFKLVDKYRMKPLVERGRQYMNLIHVDDLVRGMVMAAQSPDSIGQIYFLSGDGVYNWMDITGMIEEAAGKKAVLLSLPRFLAKITGRINDLKMRITRKPEFLSSTKVAEGLQEYWICSNEKAKRELGFYPEVPAPQGIRDTYQWYKDQGWL